MDGHFEMKALKPIEKFIRLLEGEQYVTMSAVPHRLHECRTVLTQIMATENNGIIADLLLGQLNHRLGFTLDTVNLSLCAAALDPRYGHLRFITEDLRNDIWDAVEQLCDEYFHLQTPSSSHVNIGVPNFNTINGNQISLALRTLREYHENNNLENENPLEYYSKIFFNHGRP